MITQQTIMIITTTGMMLVEGMLILKVIALTKVLHKVNDNIDQTQEKIMERLRGVVDLFLKAQSIDFNKFTGGDLKAKIGNTDIDVKVKRS